MAEKFSVEEAIMKLNDEDVEVRKIAVESLEHINNDNIVDPLIVALCDENTIVKHKAAEILGQMGEIAVDKLIDKVNNSEGDEKRFASFALKGTGSKKAIEYFSNSLEDEDWGVRKIAIRSLGELKATEYIDKIAELITKEPDWGVMLAGVHSLGDMENDEAIVAIKKIRRNAKKFLTDEQDVKDFKKAANKAIKKIEKIMKNK
ncbi:MAG: HEAT repeat domain-containing protein [Methanobrevibacter sp.]|jgi:HEAT repeat protein|nr:HEAT repeat domain-containing protein [Candidatus Methanoflexus mossambicus]